MSEKVLLTIKVGGNYYDITENDKFLDNGACIRLISQKGSFVGYRYQAIFLPKREVNKINKYKKREYKHKYGETCSVFSLLRKDN